eukprot:UN24454
MSITEDTFDEVDPDEYVPRKINKEVQSMIHDAFNSSGDDDSKEDDDWIIGEDDRPKLPKNIQNYFSKEFMGELKELRNLTLLEWCKNNKQDFTHTNGENTEIYILGTDHSHESTNRYITEMVDKVKPDIICIEDSPYSLVNYPCYKKMLSLMTKYKGDIGAIIKHEDIKTLKNALLVLDEDEPINDFLLERGHLNNIDSMTAFWLAQERGIKLKEVDMTERAQEDKTSYDNDNYEGRSQAVKLCYGFDCDITNEQDENLCPVVVGDLIESGQKELY